MDLSHSVEAFIDFYPFLSIFIPFHRGHKGSLELLKRSETDALFMPNQILKRFVKKYKDFHQKFPVEKYFRRGQNIFSRSKFSKKFPKENQ